MFEKQKHKNDQLPFVNSTYLALIAFIGIAVICLGSLWVLANNIHVNIIHSTDTPLLPVELEATPDSFWVGSMPQGVEGYVGYGSIYVDRDSRIWIAPDWAVTTRQIYDELHIKREGDYIVLFRTSVGNHRWTPGVDSGWGVKGKDNLIPVIMR